MLATGLDGGNSTVQRISSGSPKKKSAVGGAPIKQYKQYLRAVEKEFLCPGSGEKAFLRQLEEEEFFFCADHSPVSLDQLRVQFGPPEAVAQEFLSEMGSQTAVRCNRLQRKPRCLTAALLAAVLLFAAVVGLHTKRLRQQLPEKELVASISYETEAEPVSWLPLRGFVFDSVEP